MNDVVVALNLAPTLLIGSLIELTYETGFRLEEVYF